MLGLLSDIPANEVINALQYHNRFGKGLPTPEGIRAAVASKEKPLDIARCSKEEYYEAYGMEVPKELK